MTAWWEGPFLAVDTETTGVNIVEDRIVQIATAIVCPDGTVETEWEQVVNPGVPIPAEATEVHGIDLARARAEGVDPAVALRRVARYLRTHADKPVVMYNARFDLPLILNECARHGVELAGVPLVLDPFVVDKAVDRYRKGSRRLIDTAAHYGVELAADEAHGALADAIAAARLMHALVAANPKLRDLTLTEMFVRTARHAETQRESFVDYRRRTTDPTFDIPAGWPIPSGVAA